MKKNFSRLLAFLMFLCISVSCFCPFAFAAENVANLKDEPQPNELLVPKGTYGYLSGWGKKVVDANGKGEFSVWTDGDYSTAAGMTLKTECASSGGIVYISVQKPDGSYFATNLVLTGNTEKKYQMYFVHGGEYKIHYEVQASAPVTINCWIYA